MKKNLIMLVLVTIAVSLGLKLEFSTADDCYVDESNSCEGLFGELSWSCAEACDFEGYINNYECGSYESGRDESLFPRARLAFQDEDGYGGIVINEEYEPINCGSTYLCRCNSFDFYWDDENEDYDWVFYCNTTGELVWQNVPVDAVNASGPTCVGS